MMRCSEVFSSVSAASLLLSGETGEGEFDRRRRERLLLLLLLGLLSSGLGGGGGCSGGGLGGELLRERRRDESQRNEEEEREKEGKGRTLGRFLNNSVGSTSLRSTSRLLHRTSISNLRFNLSSAN